MNFLKTHIHNIAYTDLILCQPSLKIKDIPRLKEVILNANFETKPGSTLCLLQLLGLNTPLFTKNKIGDLSLNLKKGEVVGCKLCLRKKHMYAFIENFLVEILPNLKNFKTLKLNNNALHFHLKDVFSLDDLNNHISYLYGQDNLDIVIKFNSINTLFLKNLRLITRN